jgi:hypothetical protein
MAKKLESPYFIPWVMRNHLELIYNLHLTHVGVIGMGELDSTRYLDLYPNGKKFFQTTPTEMYELVDNFMQTEKKMVGNTHQENDVYDEMPFLEVRCFGCSFVENFTELEDIPVETHVCPCCGQITILYTGEDLDPPDNWDSIEEKMQVIFDDLIAKYNPDSEAST